MKDMFSTEQPSEKKMEWKKIVTPYAYAGLTERPVIHKATTQKTDANVVDIARTRKDLLISLVCQEFQIKPQEIGVNRRLPDIVHARHAYYYLLKRFTNMGLKEIGKSVGLRQDHTTVLHAIDKCRTEIELKTDIGLKINSIINAIK